MTNRKHLHLGILTVPPLLCIVLLIFSEAAYNTALETLIIVAKNVIPVLLPYTVLSSIISEIISSENGKGDVALTFILGNLCGAPVGATILGAISENGRISKKEAGYLLPAVSCSSPAFCITAVGKKLLGNYKFGILIWVTQLVLNLAIMLIFICVRDKKGNQRKPLKNKPLDIASAISRAASTLCIITVSIVFFSTIASVLSDMLKLSPIYESITNSILEMSGGCFLARKIGYPFSYLISGFALGFCGISVLIQISACAPQIPKTHYIITKVFTGFICTATAYINSSIFASAIENLTNKC